MPVWSSEGHLLGGGLLLVSSHGGRGGEGALLGLSYKGTNSIHEDYASRLNHLTKAPSPNIIMLCIRISI